MCSRRRTGLTSALSSLSGAASAHVFENMAARALDMAGHQFCRLVGFAGLHQLDQRAVLVHDRGTAGEGEIEPPGHGAQDFAMLPPELGGMAVIVPLVHHHVEGGVELAVL